MNKKSICRTSHPDRHWSIGAGFALAIGGLIPTAGYAYTAAGDRTFPALLNLPQVAPSDAVWGSFSTQPMNAFATGDPTRQDQFVGDYSKTITERLGIQFQAGLIQLDRLRTSSVTGAQNLNVLLQYEAILDPPHEFILSLEADQDLGGTGNKQVNTNFQQSATQLGLVFAKGFGDLPIGYWRPFAITGFTGFQVAEGAPSRLNQGTRQRSNEFNAGFSVQYSLPYLLSKVANIDLPQFLRGMTPMTELVSTTPVGPRYKNGSTLLVAPGFSYSEGRGWELGIEAMIPTNKATGRGIGVIAQLVVQLDYLLPDSFFGRPIFPLQ